MNTQENAPVLVKDTKNKIRVDYEGKISDKQRYLMKLKTSNFWIEKIWFVFRLIMLIGISYTILSPFITRICQSFMAREDFTDMTVNLIPKNFSTDIYKYLVQENKYFKAMGNTALLSLMCAVLQTFVCCMVGYGLSKFKFRGKKLIMFFVIMIMVIPPNTLRLSMLQHFAGFDFLAVKAWSMKGPLELLTGSTLQLTNTYWPLVILSVIGCGFKNSLYIFMMIQFFKGVPDELEESAYVDGSGPFRTFIQIILPLTIPMMVTIFLFSFSWQWTDEFYTGLFLKGTAVKTIDLLPNIYKTIPPSLMSLTPDRLLYESAIRNTAGMMIIAPLIIIYLFGQRSLVQGIERSGIVG